MYYAYIVEGDTVSKPDLMTGGIVGFTFRNVTCPTWPSNCNMSIRPGNF